MRSIIYQCDYCGYEWLPKTKGFGWDYMNTQPSCSKCGDKNVHKKEYEKIDTYSSKYRPSKSTSKT